MKDQMCGGGGSSITKGLVLLIIGGTFLMINLGIWQSAVVRTWWPLLLIVVGVGHMMGRRYPGRAV